MKHLLSISALLLLIGCGGENLDSNPDVMAMLPEGAERVFDAGNGWISFGYAGNVILVSPAGSITTIVPQPREREVRMLTR